MMYKISICACILALAISAFTIGVQCGVGKVQDRYMFFPRPIKANIIGLTIEDSILTLYNEDNLPLVKLFIEVKK